MSSTPSSRRVFVTGSAGFVGSWLTRFLIARGDEVTASQADLLDFDGLAAELGRSASDVIIHLAAISHVPTCEIDPASAFRTNVAGTASLLEAMRRTVPQARLVFTSTAQVFKAPSAGEGAHIVMDETRAIAPQNLYARTKWEAELLIEDASQRDGLKATVLRLFNHTHKSQAPDFFLPHLHNAIVDGLRSQPGQRIRVPVGNLDLKRDIGSIADLVAAFSATLDRTDASTHEVFEVCSGSPKHLASLAAELATRLGAEVDFVTDPSRLRPGDPAVIQGSHERFTRATGWTPQTRTERDLIQAFLVDP